MKSTFSSLDSLIPEVRPSAAPTPDLLRQILSKGRNTSSGSVVCAASHASRVCVAEDLVVFCPSGRAPSECCLNSAWLRPANHVPCCSHQLFVQPALTDSTSSFLTDFYSSPWLLHTDACTPLGRMSDRQVDMKSCAQVETCTFIHTHGQTHTCAYFLIIFSCL